MKIRSAAFTQTHKGLLRDLSEIAQVLDVETQLIQALMRMARQRTVLGVST
jgi:hypothetical protein